MILVVSGAKAYNDSVTAAFRELAVQVAMERRWGLSLGYVDAERQREFVAVFGGLGEMRRCPGGERARPVRKGEGGEWGATARVQETKRLGS